MAIKFNIFEGTNSQWYWNAQAGGNIIFAGGEGYEKAQKVVQVIRKNVVREDDALETSLLKALKVAGLDEKGAKPKAPKPAATTKPIKASDVVTQVVKKVKKAVA